MENNSETGKDSAHDRVNVSFKFTKKLPKASLENKLDDENASSKTDYVTQVNEKKIER